MEDGDAAMDVDGGGSMEEAPTSVVEDLVPSLTPADMTQFLNDAEPAAKPATKQKATAPMASLKGLRQADRKRKVPPAVTEREADSGDEIYIIDLYPHITPLLSPFSSNHSSYLTSYLLSPRNRGRGGPRGGNYRVDNRNYRGNSRGSRFRISAIVIASKCTFL